MPDWDLSSQELLALRKALAANISMLQLFQKYSRAVEPVSSANFTHKCICPNPGHKGGAERTPSCNFSEKTKEIHCYACNLHGDAFDLIALMTGQPAEDIIQEWSAREGFDISQLELKQQVAQADVVRILYKLSITLRNYLKEFRDTPCYEEETAWVDHAFKRIDDRFSKIERNDLVTARQVYEQVLMDLERRKMLRVEECR